MKIMKKNKRSKNIKKKKKSVIIKFELKKNLKIKKKKNGCVT